MGCCCGKESKEFKKEEENVPSNKRLQKLQNSQNQQPPPQQQQSINIHKDEVVQGGSASVYRSVDVKQKEVFKERVEDYPNDPDALTDYAIVLSSEGKDQEALDTLKKAVDIDPEHSKTWMAMAELYERKNNNEKAKEVYEKGYKHASPKLALSNEDSDFLLNFALSAQQQGDMEKAEKLFKRVTTSGPRNSRALGLYASFLLTVRNDLEKANTYFKQAADVDPPVSYWCHQYAQFLKQHMKDDQQASIYFKKSSLII